jgi:hypothetical protein
MFGGCLRSAKTVSCGRRSLQKAQDKRLIEKGIWSSVLRAHALNPQSATKAADNNASVLSAGAPVRSREASGLYSRLLFAPLFHPIFVLSDLCPSVCS